MPASSRCHTPEGRDWFPLFRAGAVAATVLLASLALWRPSPVPDSPDAGTPLPGVLAAPESAVFYSDASSEAWAGIPVPPKPAPNQETRCSQDNAEVSINGACYVATEHKPPCPGKQYEHGGKCWIAVGKREQPRQSINP